MEPKPMNVCLTSGTPSSGGKGTQLGGREPLLGEGGPHLGGRGPQLGGGGPHLGGGGPQLGGVGPHLGGGGPQLGGGGPHLGGGGPHLGGGGPQLGGADGPPAPPPPGGPPSVELSVGPVQPDEAGIASPDTEEPRVTVAQTAAGVKPTAASKHNSLTGQVTHSDQITTNAHQLDSADSPKEWHQSVSKELRDHLVAKLHESLFPRSDLWRMHDNLIDYASRMEKAFYSRANSRSEYFHLMAERIYNINYEIDNDIFNMFIKFYTP